MYHLEELLILTKTYPLPSSNYIEHTCVVAVNTDGQLRRLYPVPYRLMEEQKQFERYQWIRAKIRRSSDRRPESHNIDIDSIQLLDRLDPQGDWGQRLQWMMPHTYSCFSTLEAQRQVVGTTLGFIKVSNPKLQITREKDPNWTPDQLGYLIQNPFFAPEEARKRPILRKLPYEFHYQYQCQNSNELESHKHMVTDWEVGALYWNCQSNYQNNWEEPFREKLEGWLSGRNTIFLMGTMHRFPDQWLIVGIIYPPRLPAWQPALWPRIPDA